MILSSCTVFFRLPCFCCTFCTFYTPLCIVFSYPCPITIPFKSWKLHRLLNCQARGMRFRLFEFNFASNHPNEHAIFHFNFLYHFPSASSGGLCFKNKETKPALQSRQSFNFACQFTFHVELKKYVPIILVILFLEDFSFNHFFYSQFRFLLNLNTVSRTFPFASLHCYTLALHDFVFF